MFQQDLAIKVTVSEMVNAYALAGEKVKYFKFRACRNNNLHLEFKRLDLVRLLNQVAGADALLRE